MQKKKKTNHGSHLLSSYEHFGWNSSKLGVWVRVNGWKETEEGQIHKSHFNVFWCNEEQKDTLQCWRRKWGQESQCPVCVLVVLMLEGQNDHNEVRMRFRTAEAISWGCFYRVLNSHFILWHIAFARTDKILNIGGVNGHLILRLILREIAWVSLSTKSRFL